MAYNYHIMTYTPLETADGTALSVRVKTHLCHAQEDPTEECAESLNKPPTDGGAFRRHRDQQDRRLQQRGRFLGKVALSKFACALLLSFKANYLGTSPFVSVGTIESQLFKAS